MIDYTIFYKTELKADEEWSSDLCWDVFVSAYNSSDRVQKVYDKVNATNKHWLILPEYGYKSEEFPNGKTYSLQGNNEAEVMQSYLNDVGEITTDKRICVDTTGFRRPHLMFLLKWFLQNNIEKFDALYSEPSFYVIKEETRFSDEVVLGVRQVAGFEGNHTINTENNVLIIGSGYDHQLIAEAAESKDNAKKIQLFGLPSLRPDMYQENVLRAHRATEAVGSGAGDEPNNYFAPAYDPFVTASVLREIVERISSRKAITNLYLCPTATKPQVLGFALYYLIERQGTATSIIYPICKSYSRETGKGIARIWKYTIELPIK